MKQVTLICTDRLATDTIAFAHKALHHEQNGNRWPNEQQSVSYAAPAQLGPSSYLNAWAKTSVMASGLRPSRHDNTSVPTA